jgi:hypothetical protein
MSSVCYDMLPIKLYVTKGSQPWVKSRCCLEWLEWGRGVMAYQTTSGMDGMDGPQYVDYADVQYCSSRHSRVFRHNVA